MKTILLTASSPMNAPDIHSVVFEDAATLKILRLLLMGEPRPIGCRPG